MLRRLTIEEVAEEIGRLVRFSIPGFRRSVVAIEGPKGSGKSTLANAVASELAVIPATGPRPNPDETGDAFQRRVERWMLDLFEETPFGARLVMDRGWVSNEVYRTLEHRPGPSERYSATFLPAPRRGLVVLLDATDEDLDAARGSDAVLVRERALWRSLDLDPRVSVVRYIRRGETYEEG